MILPSPKKIAIEAVGARPVVLLVTANEAMSVSFVKFYFLKGLSLVAYLKIFELGSATV